MNFKKEKRFKRIPRIHITYRGTMKKNAKIFRKNSSHIFDSSTESMCPVVIENRFLAQTKVS